jgi:hypothetical protein
MAKFHLAHLIHGALLTAPSSPMPAFAVQRLGTKAPERERWQ